MREFQSKYLPLNLIIQWFVSQANCKETTKQFIKLSTLLFGQDKQAKTVTKLNLFQVKPIFRINQLIMVQNSLQIIKTIKQLIYKCYFVNQAKLGYNYLPSVLIVQNISLIIMKVEVPSYIIKYIVCPQQGHSDEKVNLICLDRDCHEHSLICSLCTPKHRGHTYKPIKIYLDQLYRKYKDSQNNYGQDIEQLQKRKIILLHNLKTCVEKISEEFMRLQEDILFTYQKIKDQIHENQARRNRFQDFYMSMIKDNYGDPHFEVKNYLFKDEISILTDQDIFQPIVASVQREINKVRNNFISDQRPQKIQILKKTQELVNKTAYLLPNNITFEGENFTQNNAALNAPSLCLFDLDVGQWAAKLRIQITSFPLGSKLTIGLIRKQQFLKANYLFKDTLNCMYIDSAGKSKQVQHNHLGVFVVNNIIDCFVKKNNFRMLSKNTNAIINMGDKNYYFFFAMEGGCKLKLSYPYTK